MGNFFKSILHGSPTQNLKTLDPNYGRFKKLFGTYDKQIATRYMADGTAHRVIDNKRYLLNSDAEKLINRKGSIYLLDSKNFKPDSHKGRLDWVLSSTKPEEVLREKKYDSVLQALNNRNIVSVPKKYQSYFLQKDVPKNLLEDLVGRQDRLLKTGAVKYLGHGFEQVAYTDGKRVAKELYITKDKFDEFVKGYEGYKANTIKPRVPIKVHWPELREYNGRFFAVQPLIKGVPLSTKYPPKHPFLEWLVNKAKAKKTGKNYLDYGASNMMRAADGLHHIDPGLQLESVNTTQRMLDQLRTTKSDYPLAKKIQAGEKITRTPEFQRILRKNLKSKSKQNIIKFLKAIK